MKNFNKKTKKLVLVAILVALASILSYIDKTISSLAFWFLPTAKIGLANIVVLFALYRIGFKEAGLIVITKSFLVGFLLGGPITFIISFSASLVSFISMYIFKILLKESVSAVGISVIGGTVHIVTQLLVVTIVYNLGDVVVYYGALLVVISLITSIIIGLICNKAIKYLQINSVNEEKDVLV